VFIDGFADVPVERYQFAIGGKNSPMLRFVYPCSYTVNDFQIFRIVHEHDYITFAFQVRTNCNSGF
jgi:hypothetical protein